MTPRGGARLALGGIAAAALVALLAGKQVDPGARLRVHALDLTRPRAVLTSTVGVGPSDLGYFSWTGPAPLGLGFGDLRAFDLVKLKVLATCGELPLDVSLDGARLGTVRAQGRWRELVVRLPRAGGVLQLARLSREPCPVHFSRVKSTNAVGYSSSFPQLFVRYDPRPYRLPRFPRAKVAKDVAAAVAAWGALANVLANDQQVIHLATGRKDQLWRIRMAQVKDRRAIPRMVGTQVLTTQSKRTRTLPDGSSCKFMISVFLEAQDHQVGTVCHGHEISDKFDSSRSPWP